MHRAQCEEHAACQREQPGAHGVHHAFARNIDRATQRRADDHRRLHAHRTHRRRARNQTIRHQQRHHRLLGRILKAFDRTECHRHRQQQRAIGPAAERRDRQHSANDRFYHHAQHKNQPAVAAIGGVARRQSQYQRRQELREPDQPQVPGAARQVVHLPAHRHHHHLVAGRCTDTPAPEAQEAWDLQWGGGIGG